MPSICFIWFCFFVFTLLLFFCLLLVNLLLFIILFCVFLIYYFYLFKKNFSGCLRIYNINLTLTRIYLQRALGHFMCSLRALQWCLSNFSLPSFMMLSPYILLLCLLSTRYNATAFPPDSSYSLQQLKTMGGKSLSYLHFLHFWNSSFFGEDPVGRLMSYSFWLMNIMYHFS